MTSERDARTQQGTRAVRDVPNEAFQEAGHRGRMLSNNSYNLVTELSELLTGLWRVDEYLKDAGHAGCQDCGQLWQDVRKQKEILIEKIRQEVVEHAKAGTFT
jgi:hypothetical protein